MNNFISNPIKKNLSLNPLNSEIPAHRSRRWRNKRETHPSRVIHSPSTDSVNQLVETRSGRIYD